jgi:catechol 2,3-dioxygenase-like lactoylglutathione lyase family enzyme
MPAVGSHGCDRGVAASEKQFGAKSARAPLHPAGRPAKMLSMRVEHIAFQVKDPVAVADWYVKNLGFRVARHAGGPANTHFLADAAGHVVLELYSNAAAPQPDYAAMHPLMLHVAFAVEDVKDSHDRLLAAGATSFSLPETTAAGDQFAMLRDPFGLPIQLVHRQAPLLG